MPTSSLPNRSSSPLRLMAESGDIDLLRSNLKLHYRTLSPRSRRLRFLGNTSVEAVDRMAERAAPELLLEVVENGAVCAVLEAYATSPGHAEVAISVEDQYQGKGIGRALFKEGLAVLASRGFRTVDLLCLRENTALLHLVSRTGARLRADGGEVHVEIELDQVRSPELDPVRSAA